MALLALGLTSLHLHAPAAQAAAVAPWAHSWDTAGQAWWGDFGYSLLNDEQAAFIANNYYMASLEKCTGKGQGLVTEQGIYQTAKQLKAHNPAVKTVFYWHTGQAGIGCFAAQAEFLAHEEWWLKDDHGNVVGHKDSTHPAGQPRIDWTIEAAADWWVSVPLRGYNGTTAAEAKALIDGVLADGAAFESIPNITMARLQTLNDAKLGMIQKLQQQFDAVGRGGVVFGNGLGEYDQSPTDPHNKRILAAVQGVQNEHYAAFEQVLPDGSLNLPKVADTLANIEWAALSNVHGAPGWCVGCKQIFCSFWAGPYTGFSSEPGRAKGWPKYHDNSQPCGSNSTQGVNCTAAEHFKGWQEELDRWLPFNLASFLLVAMQNTWFTQAVWYADNQGFAPCRTGANAGQCAFDPSFYSDYLKQPLGKPLNTRVQVGDYKWTREFEHATVTVDLTSPLEGTSIVFHKSNAA